MRRSAFAAVAALAMIGRDVIAGPSVGRAPPRGYGRAYRPSPALVRKTPSTPSDDVRLDDAAAKRSRKAAKLVRDAERSAAGYYFRPKAKPAPEPVAEAVKPKRTRRKAA